MALVAGVAVFETAFAWAMAFMFERTVQAHTSRTNTAVRAAIAIKSGLRFARYRRGAGWLIRIPSLSAAIDFSLDCQRPPAFICGLFQIVSQKQIMKAVVH